jgi:hypothetical protein
MNIDKSRVSIEGEVHPKVTGFSMTINVVYIFMIPFLISKLHKLQPVMWKQIFKTIGFCPFLHGNVDTSVQLAQFSDN